MFIGNALLGLVGYGQEDTLEDSSKAAEDSKSDRLCGGALVTPPEGMSLLLHGRITGGVGKDMMVLTQWDSRSTLLRMVTADQGPDDPNPGILLETPECFPIAFLCCKDAAVRNFKLFKPDHSEFAVMTSEPGSSRVTVNREDGTVMAFVCVDMMGHVANVVGRQGELLATVSPQRKGNGGSESEDVRVLRLAPAVDAGVIVCALLVVMKLGIGHI
mmetsp:Transcript_32895/g.71784  ORF Transcript_32895/g.71784 Transcript_32895/m.71784 type:complete len:216 (+) Transcript_32895:65-712(+)